MSDSEGHFIIPQADDPTPVRAIATVGVVTVVVIIAAVSWSGWLLGREEVRLGARVEQAEARPGRAPAEIGIIDQTLIHYAHPGMTKIRAQNRRLASWGRISTSTSAVHMPIDRAIDVVLEREGK
ncbi:hypothetical protein L6R52_18005 [Myxococcota bacterium]|nr:hypothetical protein [Myxococcota bacterium]